MGLDVYLYRYENREATASLEAAYEQRSEEIWRSVGGDYNTMTEGQRAEASAKTKQIAAEMGLGEHGEDPRKTQVEINSAKHPDCMFKIGYFRSSYNSGGINRILSEHLNTTLDEIMGYDGEYVFQPDWAAARGRANAALADLRDLDKNTTLSCIEIDVFNALRGLPDVTDRAQAIKIAQKQIDEHKGEKFGFSDYSNADGLFLFGQKPQVIAFIAGKKPFLGSDIPTVFAITEAKPGDVFGWYVQAMEVVVETCDYVLAMPPEEQAKHWLHWSG